MIDWKSIDNFFLFLLALLLSLIPLGLLYTRATNEPGVFYSVILVIFCCILVPAVVHVVASSHNAAGIKRIRSWAFFITSNVTTYTLILGWPAYSVGTFGLVVLSTLSVWILIELLARGAGTRGITMDNFSRMYVGVGQISGFLFPIIFFIILTIYETGIYPFESLPITAFFLVFSYPIILLASCLTIVIKISPSLYSRRLRRKKVEGKHESVWSSKLKATQPWAVLALLVMVVDTGRRNKRTILLFVLSMASLALLGLTAQNIGYFGWLLITTQSGMTDTLLVMSLVFYFRIDTNEMMLSDWASQ
ncbi:MAG TPA: hypothetical protein VGS11_04195 [Candidatus Bathyarchaeia archaeon]|nr:hypothetical protein [Candidatus Bathyarchaeia archaeon]